MGCGISNSDVVEDQAGPACMIKHLYHQDNYVQPSNYEDADDDGRKQNLKRIKTRCVYSDQDSMEKQRGLEENEDHEVCGEREDSLMIAPPSPSFRVYCLDSDSGNSSKEEGDGVKSENKSKVCLDSDMSLQVSTIQIAKKGRKGRGFMSVLKKARLGKKNSLN